MYKSVPFVLFALFVLFLSAPARADFDSANHAYDQGDFTAARTEYQRLIDTNGPRANLYHNLGNAAYRAGDKSAAFLAWERALALDASHADTLKNLQLLRTETGAKIPAPPWFEPVLPSANTAAWLAAGGFWSLCFCLLRRRARIAAPACALALNWGAAALVWHQQQGELWIITAPTAAVHTAPAQSAPATLTLPMGSRLRLLQERGPWIHAALPDAATGWIAMDSVQPVPPPPPRALVPGL